METQNRSLEHACQHPKSIDKNHLMTFHPFGRTLSAEWFNDAPWLDFNMFQSGHRRYGQSKDDKKTLLPQGTEEDNWRDVEHSLAQKPLRRLLMETVL